MGRVCDKLEEGPVFEIIPDLLTVTLCDLGHLANLSEPLLLHL